MDGKLQIPVRLRSGQALHFATLRSEAVTFLISLVVCGRKAPKSACQQASPGFLRLRSGQALRLRAINPLLCDRSARRFAPTAGAGRMTPFWRGLNNIWSGAKNTRRSKKSQALLMNKRRVWCRTSGARPPGFGDPALPGWADVWRTALWAWIANTAFPCSFHP